MKRRSAACMARAVSAAVDCAARGTSNWQRETQDSPEHR